MGGQHCRTLLRSAVLVASGGLVGASGSALFPYLFENSSAVAALASFPFVLGVASIVAPVWREGRR